MNKAWGTKAFLASMFWILVKMPTSKPGVEISRTMPFLFNRTQEHLENNLARNNRVLKYRQAGITTYFLIRRLLMNVILEGGKTGMLISQNNKYAAQHFMIAHRAYRLIGAQDPNNDSLNSINKSLKQNLLHTQFASRRELFFDILDSKLIVESAEVEEAGQGVTIHHVVSSETARWPGDPEATTSNIKGGLVPGGTYDEESTANGAAGYFHSEYLKAMDNPELADAKAHFYPWWWADEYEVRLSDKEKREMEKDLTASEYALIRKMHSELKAVA